MNYSEKLKDPRWQKKRLKILERDKFTCTSCTDKENQLHVHHIKYIFGNEIWDYDDKLLITLCADCHDLTTSFKKSIKDIIDINFTNILQIEHLHRILAEIKNADNEDFWKIIEFINTLNLKNNG